MELSASEFYGLKILYSSLLSVLKSAKKNKLRQKYYHVAISLEQILHYPYDPYFGVLAAVFCSSFCLYHRNTRSVPVLLERTESVTIKYSGEQEVTKEKHTATRSAFKPFSFTWKLEK